MGDATPEAARPDVLDAGTEERFTDRWARDALDGLRRKRGATHAFGIGNAMFTGWRLDGTGPVMRSLGPDGLDVLVGMDLDPLRWCTACGEPVRPDGYGVPGSGVHIGIGPYDHDPAVTDEDPVLRAQADELEAEFPEVSVSVRFRIFRADWRATDGRVRPHFDASDADAMRRQLAAATGREVPS